VIAVIIGVNIMGEGFTSTIYLGSAIVLIGIAVTIDGDVIKIYRLNSYNA
jgi:drug/metabolite transporter (DMT)-like permease